VTQETVGTIVAYVTGVSAIVVCLPLIVFLRGPLKKIRFGQRLVSVNDYLAWVSEIETQAHAIEDGPHGARLAPELQLRRRLSHLKLQAMDTYRQGLIADPDHMGNLLAQISDTRIHLNALILAAEQSEGAGHTGHIARDGNLATDAAQTVRIET
jgi:hypothetical protein